MRNLLEQCVYEWPNTCGTSDSYYQTKKQQHGHEGYHPPHLPLPQEGYQLSSNAEFIAYFSHYSHTETSNYQSPTQANSYSLSTMKSPMTRVSIPLFANVFSAFSGVFTTGSPRTLNDVFSRMGTPVALPKVSIRL